MNKLATVLHDATHLVPGVPAHRENPQHSRPQHSHPAAAVNGRPTPTSIQRHHKAAERHQRPPRVLVGWQNWIADRVGQNHRAG